MSYSCTKGTFYFDMLGHVVMASNRIDSGLQVTDFDGSSALNHGTVLYLDPVHAAPRGGLMRPQIMDLGGK